MNLLLSFLFVTTLYAKTDFSFFSSLRTYPAPGIEAGVELGEGIYLWNKTSTKPFLFGFIRPKIKAVTSAVVNNASAAIEVFPISILGLELGYQYIKSDYEGFSFYKCDEVRCRGEIHRQYVALKGALGYAKMLGTYSLQLNRNRYTNANSKEVAEFRTGNLIGRESEVSYEARYVLGYKLGDDMIGILSEYHKFSDTKAFNQMNLLIYSQKFRRSNVIYGAGTFESAHVAKGFIAVLQYKFDFLKKIALF